MKLCHALFTNIIEKYCFYHVFMSKRHAIVCTAPIFDIFSLCHTERKSSSPHTCPPTVKSLFCWLLVHFFFLLPLCPLARSSSSFTLQYSIVVHFGFAAAPAVLSAAYVSQGPWPSPLVQDAATPSWTISQAKNKSHTLTAWNVEAWEGLTGRRPVENSLC